MKKHTFNEILRTIQLYREYIPNAVHYFTNGNCYGFALILQDRFPGGQIYTDETHAIYVYDNQAFDITGNVKIEKHIPLKEYSELEMKQRFEPKLI
jgi:hypothetical protein